MGGVVFNFTKYIEREGWDYDKKEFKHKKTIQSSYFEGESDSCEIEFVTQCHVEIMQVYRGGKLIYRGHIPKTEQAAKTIFKHISLPCND